MTQMLGACCVCAAWYAKYGRGFTVFLVFFTVLFTKQKPNIEQHTTACYTQSFYNFVNNISHKISNKNIHTKKINELTDPLITITYDFDAPPPSNLKAGLCILGISRERSSDANLASYVQINNAR